MKTINLVNPILIFNLGVEMIHIIHQRLIVQKIEKERIQLVMNELVITLHQRMQDNIKSMEVATYQQDQIYTLMEQIAHSSIIKLNQQSMNNLYYLITMSLKMYIQQTNAPVEIYHVTLKHFNGIEQLGLGSLAQKTLNTCLEQFNQLYAKLTPEEYATIKIELLKACQQKLNKQPQTTLNKGELYNKQQSKPSELFQQKSITHNLNLDPSQQQQELNDLATLIGAKQCNYEPITLFNQQIRQQLQEDPEQLQIQVETNKSTTMKQNIMEQFKETDVDGEQDLLDLMDQANDY